MKQTMMLVSAIVLVALSLLLYGCGPVAQAPEKSAPASTLPATTATQPEPAAPQAPATTATPGGTSAPPAATTVPVAQEAAPDSDFNVNPGPAESNPADLPEPSAPQ